MRRRVRMPDAELEPLLQEESRSCWGNYTIIAHHPSDRVPQAHHRPFVHKGYRLQQSVVSSIPSLFAIHNETVNIWTHLAGFVYFVYVSPETIQETARQGSAWDVAVFSMFLLSVQLCLGFSVLFHLFSCVNELWASRFFALDLLGIATLIFGSFLIGIYQGFYCHPPFIVTYVLVILVMMVCSGGLAVIRKFRATEYDYLRNGVYVGTVVFAVVPIVHWVVLCADGPSGKCELTFLTSCLLMLASYALGFCIYASKVPERFAPGYFDYLLASHQLWHVMVVTGAIIWYLGNMHVFRARVGVDAVCGNEASYFALW